MDKKFWTIIEEIFNKKELDSDKEHRKWQTETKVMIKTKNIL